MFRNDFRRQALQSPSTGRRKHIEIRQHLQCSELLRGDRAYIIVIIDPPAHSHELADPKTMLTIDVDDPLVRATRRFAQTFELRCCK